MTNKTVLVTCYSSGFGNLAAKTFSKKGWNIIATMRSLEQEPTAPWGGYKQSGIGREAREWGIDDMLEVKSSSNFFTEDTA